MASDTVRIDRKDQAFEIMDKVNAALKEHGLVFEDVSKDGDDRYVLTLKKTAAVTHTLSR